MEARQACRSAALQRWHWEHEDERGALLGRLGTAFA
jgi:hypothetical protein